MVASKFVLGAFAASVSALTMPYSELGAAILLPRDVLNILEARQDPGTPAYNCHNNCGQAIIRIRNVDSVCEDDIFLTDYNNCLQCSGPDNEDIWKYYGTTLSTAASACGLSTTPLSGEQEAVGEALAGTGTATVASATTSAETTSASPETTAETTAAPATTSAAETTSAAAETTAASSAAVATSTVPETTAETTATPETTSAAAETTAAVETTSAVSSAVITTSTATNGSSVATGTGYASGTGASHASGTATSTATVVTAGAASVHQAAAGVVGVVAFGAAFAMVY